MMLVRVLCAALLPLCLVASGPAWSEADDQQRPSSERWVPGLTLGMMIFGYSGEGKVLSSVGLSNGGQDSDTVPVLRLGMDLHSPALELPMLSPRLIGFGGFHLAPTQQIDLARFPGESRDQPETGIKQAVALWILDPSPNPLPPANAFSGQGSQVNATYEGFGWFAGVGATFGVPSAESIIRVKPYVSYVGERVSATGAVVAVQGVGPNYTVFRSYRESEEDFHYLGPGFAAEAVLMSGESFEMVVFGEADFLWNVGDGSIVMTEPGVAVYTYDADPLSIRGAFGVRLAWKTAFGR